MRRTGGRARRQKKAADAFFGSAREHELLSTVKTRFGRTLAQRASEVVDKLPDGINPAKFLPEIRNEFEIGTTRAMWKTPLNATPLEKDFPAGL